MSKIKLLILLLVSFIFLSCTKDNPKQNNIKYSLGYIGGEYDGLMLKNYMNNYLLSFDLYDAKSNLDILPNISHSSSLFITNIDNTSDRMRVESILVIKVNDKRFKCVTYKFEEKVSQFYIFADSRKYISNNIAEKKIKEQNTETLVKKFINKLMRSKGGCMIKNE